MRIFAILVLVLGLNGVTGAPAAFAQTDAFIIYPGLGIGPLRLGMNVRRDVVPLIGAWKTGVMGSEGAATYLWFTVQTDANGLNHGGGIAMTEERGAVGDIFVYHDPRYAIQGIHTGSGEVAVRSALGEPVRVTTEEPRGPGYLPPKDLVYRGLLLVIGQTASDPDGDYQKVFEIHVVRP